MTLTNTPGQAFDKIALDLMGPLPTTSAGNKYLLTIQDLLTKYSVAVPLKSASAMDTADGVIEGFVCRFGAPKAILTDQGTNFLSSLMRSVTRKFRISQYKTTAFHPQSNGSLERSHHVLTEYLKQYVRKNNWDTLLPYAMFSYNTSVYEGTSFTPHELVFEKLARVPSADTPFDATDDNSYNSYLIDLREKLSESTLKARENLNQSKIRSKRYYDRRVNTQSFSVGDHVLLLKEPRHGKFDNEYVGPFQIIEILP